MLFAAKILVLHGDADPVVPLESVIAFREEMRLADANWQINIYGEAKHSFTGEGAVGDRTPEAGLHAQRKQDHGKRRSSSCEKYSSKG
jgi:dienelactone hydrolase